MPIRDPLTSYHFYLEVDGITSAIFRECSGMSSESQVIEYKDAMKGGVTRIRKVPGVIKWGDITMKNGVTDDLALWKWRKDIEDGNVEKARKNGSITLFDQANIEKARWNFEQAWPSKISGPDVNANQNEVAVEALTICIEGLKRVK